MGKTLRREAVFSKVLRSQKNKCARCGVSQHSTAYRSTGGGYEELDTFEANATKLVGVKTVKIFLRLAFVDGDNENFTFHNMLALCPMCSAEHLKRLKINFQQRALGKLAELRINEVMQVKNFFYNELNITLNTRNTLRIISLISKIIENDK